MCARHRHLVQALVVAVMLVWPSLARAWVETSIKSSVVTVDVARDGKAVVSHELLLRVRGGPLKSLELAGVDADAELLPDASVTAAKNGDAAVTPIPLLIEKRDDASLAIEMDDKKGLRRGSYLFKFSYRTNLLSRNMIEAQAGRVKIRWVGPRFDDGVDSAKVVLRIPPAKTPPSLPEVDLEEQAATDRGDVSSVFVSNLRRASDKDELELTRSHVAKGEPVVWEILADSRALTPFAAPDPGPAPAVRPNQLESPRQRSIVIGALALLALVYALLVSLKWRALGRACAERSAEARALIPLPVLLRASLAGSALAGAVALSYFAEMPTLGGALLVLSMALATQITPSLKPVLRGPGRWLPLSDDEAFGGKQPSLPGRWLDTGTLPGFILFALLLAVFAGVAFRVFPRSPYHALMLLLGSASLLPIFCTGRASELPLDPAFAPRKFLSRLAGKLRRSDALKVVPWARIPDAASAPDELRLLVMPRRARAGLIAVEVGLEYQHGSGGPIRLPVVLVRARDDSESYRALPRSVVWTRGRKPEERVSVLRPKLPTPAMTLELVLDLAERLSADGQPASRTRANSGGRGAATVKPGSVASPAHAI